MPAISTTRRSCISPQRPRTCGWRSALTRFDVSLRSCVCVSASERTCWLSSAYAPIRDFSISCTLVSNLSSDSRIGFTSSSIACWRSARSPFAASWCCASDACASSMNAWLLLFSASADSALNACVRFSRARSISASLPAAASRSIRSAVARLSALPWSSVTEARVSSSRAPSAASCARASPSSRSAVLARSVSWARVTSNRSAACSSASARRRLASSAVTTAPRTRPAANTARTMTSCSVDIVRV